MAEEPNKEGYENRKKTDVISKSKLPNVGTKLEELTDDALTREMPAILDIKTARYCGIRQVLEIIDDITRTAGIKPGQAVQFEMLRARLGRTWYIFGESSEYGVGISNEYLIEPADKTRKVSLEKIGHLAARLIKINKETGKPFSEDEINIMLVDIRPYLPNTPQPQAKESEAKTKTDSVRLKTGTFRARFE